MALTKEKLLELLGGGEIPLMCPHRIGDVLQTVNSIPPSESWPGTTWVPWAPGRVPVSVDVTDADFNAVGKIGGEKTHTLQANQMPPHTNHVGAGKGGTATLPAWTIVVSETTGPNITNDNYLALTGPDRTGATQPFGILQPYATCYMWLRTA